MVNITYTASSGHVYDLQAKTILQREANYHIWEWSPVATELQYGAKVSAFGRGPAVYTTQLVFRGPQNQRKALIEALHEDFERDVRTMTPGRITWGDYYINCYISSSDTHPDDTYLCTDNDISIYCPHPFWVKEDKRTFMPQEAPGGQTFLDYEFDYAYDYFYGNPGIAIWQTGIPFGSEFILTFFGPAVDPRILINGYPYQVFDTLEASEHLTINSQKNTVIKTLVNGQTVNDFDLRNKAQSVFKQIPGGTLTLNWSGAFGFDLTIFEERSEPRWTV